MYNLVLVEDELIELEALRKIINKDIDGITLFEANRGNEAIRLIDELSTIDLILVDINIPLPNGLDVIRYLRNKSKNTKVIVTTANDDIDIARHMFGLKVDDYLLKPIKPQVLIDTIKNSLAFNENQHHEIKQKKILLNEMLDKCQYVEWFNFIIDNLSSPDTLSESDNHLIDLMNILNQVIEQKGWVIPELSKYSPFLSSAKVTRNNYYKILRMLIDISNGIFDVAYKNSNLKFSPIQRAQYYIERNVLGNVTLDSAADNAYLSACYLSRLFKKQCNIGFSEYLSKRKLELAKLLLIFSDLQINTIALELCYNDANYFCRLFKKEFGLSPSEFRRLKGP